MKTVLIVDGEGAGSTIPLAEFRESVERFGSSYPELESLPVGDEWDDGERGFGMLCRVRRIE